MRACAGAAASAAVRRRAPGRGSRGTSPGPHPGAAAAPGSAPCRPGAARRRGGPGVRGSGRGSDRRQRPARRSGRGRAAAAAVGCAAGADATGACAREGSGAAARRRSEVWGHRAEAATEEDRGGGDDREPSDVERGVRPGELADSAQAGDAGGQGRGAVREHPVRQTRTAASSAHVVNNVRRRRPRTRAWRPGCPSPAAGTRGTGAPQPRPAAATTARSRPRTRPAASTVPRRARGR